MELQTGFAEIGFADRTMHACIQHMIVHCVQKFHDSAASASSAAQATREAIVQNRRSTFMMEDGEGVAEVDNWLQRAQVQSCGSGCADDQHCQKSEETQTHGGEPVKK